MKHINSKKLYLIYTDLPTNFKNENIIEILFKKIKIDNYIISQEIINDDLKTVHIFFEKKNSNIRITKTKLNLIIDNVIYIPSFEKCVDKNYIIKNISEKKEVLTNFQNILNNQIHIDPTSYLLELAKTKTPYEIESILIEKFGKLYMKKGASLSNTLKKISEHYTNKRNEIEINFSLESFDKKKIPKEVFDWLKNPTETVLILGGISNTGKTELGLSLLKDKQPILINNIQQLREFDGSKNGSILFDDCDLSGLIKEELIGILDKNHPRAVRLPYCYGTIPKDTIKIITTNKKNISKYDQDLEITRRVTKVFIKEKMYKNVVINIQNNINNYFNKKN